MRVIWVAPSAPSHEGGGDQQRQAYLLDVVARKVETHLVVAGQLEDDEVRRLVASVTEVERPVAVPQSSPAARRLRLLRDLVGERVPWMVARSRKLRRRLDAACREIVQPGDVVVVEHLELAPLVRTRPEGTRWVLTLHLSHSRYAAHERQLADSPPARWYWAVQERRARHFERWAVDVYDEVVAASPIDARTLGGEVVVIPNGVDPEVYVQTALPGDRSLVMTGTLDYPPNVDGLQWFCDEVWPLVRRRCPDATLTMVGRDPAPEVHALSEVPGVDLAADVPKVQPYLETARAVIVPIRLGGGTRLKALQALAAGRPVVGTTIGLEGLDLEAGVHVLVADAPQTFAEACLQVLTDDDCAASLADAGRVLVEDRYAWGPLGESLVDVLRAAEPSTVA